MLENTTIHAILNMLKHIDNSWKAASCKSKDRFNIYTQQGSQGLEIHFDIPDLNMVGIFFHEIRSGKGLEFAQEDWEKVGNLHKISWNGQDNNLFGPILDYTQLVTLEYTQWLLDLPRVTQS